MMGSRRFRLGEAMSILARRGSRAVGKLTRLHALEQSEILFHRSVAIGALLAGLSQGAAMFAYFVGRQIANESVAGLDQLNGPLIELVEIVGRVEKPVAPIAAEPADILDDRVDVLGFFFRRIGVVEAQVAFAAELRGQPEIQVDGFGVADVQIAVRLRRKTRMHAPAVLVGLQIIQDDVADEVGNRRIGAGVGLGVLGFQLFNCATSGVRPVNAARKGA